MGTDSPSFPQRLLQALAGPIIVIAGLGGYLFVLKWRGPAVVTYTRTAWDDFIPFQPGWLYVYFAPYALTPVILGLMRRDTFLWFLKRALLIQAVSLLIFAVVPTQTVRPSLDGLEDGWTAQLYRDMIALDDPPANAAPSLHVSLTCLIALALLRDFPRWWPVIIGGVALVWLATLFTWQHHLMDVATGAMLGIMAGCVGRRPTASKLAG